MAAIIADELRGSDESADGEAAKVVKKPKVMGRKKGSKTRSRPTSLLTRNSFDPLTVEEASNDGNYSDEIPLLESDTDSDAEDITNEEVRIILSSNFKINRYILFQLANSLAIKTIAEHGAAAGQPRKKKKADKVASPCAACPVCKCIQCIQESPCGGHRRCSGAESVHN